MSKPSSKVVRLKPRTVKKSRPGGRRGYSLPEINDQSKWPAVIFLGIFTLMCLWTLASLNEALADVPRDWNPAVPSLFNNVRTLDHYVKVATAQNQLRENSVFNDRVKIAGQLNFVDMWRPQAQFKPFISEEVEKDRQYITDMNQQTYDLFNPPGGILWNQMNSAR